MLCTKRDVEHALVNVIHSVLRMQVYISVNCFLTVYFIYNDKIVLHVTLFYTSVVACVVCVL